MCQTDAAATSLANYSGSCTDDYVKAQLAGLTSADIIAQEFYYHRSCQRTINHMDKNTDDQREQKQHVREQCFNELLEFVRKSLIEERKFTTVAELSLKYKDLQLAKEIGVKGILHKDVKRKLQLEFDDDFVFYQKSRRQYEYIYYRNTPVEENDRSWFFMNIEEKVVKMAEVLRDEIEKFPSPFSEWPPNPDVVYDQDISIPSLLKSFLKTLLSKKSTNSARLERLTNSIGPRYHICPKQWPKANHQTSPTWYDY